MIIVLLNFALVASIFVVNKYLLTTIPPFLLTGITSLIAFIMLWSYRTIIRSTDHLAYQTILKIMGAGLCIGYGATVLKYYVLQGISPLETSIVFSLDPFITLALVIGTIAYRINAYQIVGIVLAVAGSLSFALLNTQGGLSFAHTHFYLIIIASIILNRSGWIFLARTLQQTPVHFLLVSALLALVGGVTASATSACIEQIPSVLPLVFLVALAYSSIVNSIVCSTAYVHFLKQYSVLFLSLAELSVPFFVAGYEYLSGQQTMPLVYIFATSLLLLGITTFHYYDKHIH